MNEIRRIILWLVFVFSLALLWDQWEISQGRKAMFMPTPTKAVPTAAAPQTTNDAPAPVVNAAVPQMDNQPAASTQSERIEVTTDVLKLTFDTQGGNLLRAELLKHVDVHRPGQNVVLLDDSKERLYMAQTGLIGGPTGSDWPTHKTAMRFSGATALKDGEQSLQVKFESVNDSDVKLVKTYNFERGNYAVKVQHDIINKSSSAITPQLYVQLVRDGNKPDRKSTRLNSSH